MNRTQIDARDWALVLQGGGNRGAIQAGALLALFETGFVPRLIIGVSVGAINGAYLAFHPDVDGASRLIDIWRHLDGRTLFGSRFPRLRTLATLLGGRTAAFSNENLGKLLTRSLPSDRFDDTVVPFVAVATHLATGTARALAAGSISRAVLASAALPAHFPPVTINGELLVDGAVADPVPLHLAWERGLTRAVVVDPGFSCDCPRVYDSGMAIVQQAVATLARRCIVSELTAAEDHLRVLHLGLSCHTEVPMTDLSQTEQMIRSGYLEASAALASTPPWAGTDHHLDEDTRERKG